MYVNAFTAGVSAFVTFLGFFLCAVGLLLIVGVIGSLIGTAIRRLEKDDDGPV